MLLLRLPAYEAPASWARMSNIQAALAAARLLQQQNWAAQPAGYDSEFVGLCPLHQETRPSFYVNARKNLFYCHGCGLGGDLIRFVELSRHLSFRQSLAYLEQQSAPPVDSAAVLEEAAAFYQEQLDCYPEALRYLKQRGLHDLAVIQALRIGYAPGACSVIYRPGYSFDLLRQVGLVNLKAATPSTVASSSPCSHGGRLVNLYGRSLGDAPIDFCLAPRAACMPGSRFGIALRYSRRGLFDYAVLWQAGFITHLLVGHSPQRLPVSATVRQQTHGLSHL